MSSVPSVAHLLPEDPPQEERIPDEVAPPKTAGLNKQPSQPFQAVVGHPAGGTAQFAGGIVKDGPTGEGHVGFNTIPVLHQPVLLKGHAEAHDEDVGLPSVDFPNDCFILRTTGRFVKVAVVGADNAQIGEALAQAGRGLICHARAGAEEEEGEVTRLGELGQLPYPVGVGDALGTRVA